MTNPVDEQKPTSGKRAKVVRWLTIAGVITGIGVFADVSQVFGVSVVDALDYVRGRNTVTATPSAGPGSAPASTPPSSTPTSTPTSPPSSGGSSGTGGTVSGGSGNGGGLGNQRVPVNPTTTTPKVIDTTTPPVTVSARATITAPANGLTTQETKVTLSISASPATVSGWVWYVVVQPAHHTTSDYLYRLRPETGTLTVGIGPATGGSGATDDYVIRPALIRSAAATDIGGYRDDVFAPADTRYFTGITIHRESQ
ncbi:hypothetical protein BJ973_003011 [Actinoplanes tereljensis]|uniref:Uncharacterized protein n=1 Tax=Paractinoplanes tereljensis TaxID=571912 RepID=A0A919NPK6_9ACTN|nr:hypothetical protein [Actinoplanes tereljensis]GIF22690.1 hypothetical protein Ate02nite_54200 [Actinoplanes tereljensis]